MKSIVTNAFLNAAVVAFYIVGVVSLLFYAPKTLDETDGVLVPITMLMLFVFSAAFTGLMMFGRPILWYLNGKKKEAVSLVVFTLGIFLVITFMAFLSLVFYLR